ncbi:hypothetical protein [Ohtaekwangia koreensis]|uniref:Dolichyl-phosphate-mannose-protein mannosyltransferase n=1 Tax=Ohtaekwangia koreensis TaxID=688867 RepID=A0A1T5IXC2_9BACT|nr:hypothetical protein [Ohtaekwangia koreensis]SKC43784.1 hypothetical protein SAMN05660236_0505 [Ohtaekwangia koreensis]
MNLKLHLPDIKKYRLHLFVFILVIKLFQTGYFIYLTKCSNPEIEIGDITFASGDTFSYTGAMENYNQTGSYYFYNGKENVYAGRLPHYSIPYLLFRQFASQPLAYDLLAIFQLLIECIATYYLIRLFLNITNSNIFSYILLGICLLASNATVFSIYASPESLSCSLLIFTLYHYHKFLKEPTNTNLFITGIFIGLLVTLKAYFVILFIPIGIQFLQEIKDIQWITLRRIIAKTLIISTPLIILLSPWTIRNYTLYKRLIPLQINSTAGYNYTNAELAFRRFVTAWGGDFIHWEKTSAGCYFIPNPEIPCEFKMPAYAYTSKYSQTDIDSLRAKFIRLQKHYTEPLDKEVTATFDRFTREYKNEKPFQSHIIAPNRLISEFLVHSGSYYLPIHSANPCFHPLQLSIKLSQSLLYWMSLIIGIPGIILLSARNKNYLFAFTPISLIILFPIIFHFTEARYFRTVEPVLYTGASYLLLEVYKRFFKVTA